jgi:transcriptional regulator of acetoin/glycerol metabolism
MLNAHDDTCFNPNDAMGIGQRLCTCGAGFTDEIIPLAELEEWAIRRALRATGGSVMQASRLLKIGRATIYRKLAAYEGTV